MAADALLSRAGAGFSSEAPCPRPPRARGRRERPSPRPPSPESCPRLPPPSRLPLRSRGSGRGPGRSLAISTRISRLRSSSPEGARARAVRGEALRERRWRARRRGRGRWRTERHAVHGGDCGGGRRGLLEGYVAEAARAPPVVCHEGIDHLSVDLKRLPQHLARTAAAQRRVAPARAGERLSTFPLTDQGRLEQNNCVFERGRSVSCCAICADVTTFLVAPDATRSSGLPRGGRRQPRRLLMELGRRA